MYLQLPFSPTPRGRPRFNFTSGHAYKNPKSRKFEDELRDYIIMNFNIETHDGPLCADIKFTIKRPKSVKRQFPSVKPDVDNLAKPILDVIQKCGIIKNDSQIINLNLKKEYGERDLIEVSLSKIDETTANRYRRDKAKR